MLSSIPSRLAAFAAGLAVVGGGAAALGATTDATPPFQDCLKVAAAEAGFGEGRMADEGHGGERMVEAIPGADGLRPRLAGVTLLPVPRTFTPGGTATWRFMITDCKGNALRDFEPENGRLLHLIVARKDLTAYQHLHPRLHPDGRWSVELATPRAGDYRAIADFVVDGRKYVLGTTLHVPGAAQDRPLPAPAVHGRADGYDVELQRPAELEAGRDAQLTFRITRHGRPVRDLQPYLGAYGHLVALHAPDLAYSHVHPDGEDRDEGAITFDTELHRRGTYRLFLQFQTAGRVHTVAFTQTVS
jgi:hypothetical protein